MLNIIRKLFLLDMLFKMLFIKLDFIYANISLLNVFLEI